MAKPKTRRHVGFCPTCGNTAPQRVVDAHLYSGTWYSEEGRPRRGLPDLYAVYCICETCDAPVLYDGIDPRELDFPSWPQLVYPRVADYDDAVPSAVQKIYHQAISCKQQSPLAFAILIRKALEAICDERGVEKGKRKERNLSVRLQKLIAKAQIPPILAKMTDVLRTLGNTAAHDAPDDVTVPMTWAIDDFFQAIVEYVYVAPSKLAEFEERLAKIKNVKSGGA